MKVFILTCSFLISSIALAGIDMPELKSQATAKFLSEANNPKTKLAKRIDQINEENTDGRNPDGSIEIPVKPADIQVSTLSAETLYNPWHYAGKSEDELTCTAGGNTATYLILLASHMGVHGAGEDDTYAFVTTVSESQTAVRKDGGKIEYCEDVAYDEHGEYVVSPIDYSVSDFLEVVIPRGNE